MRAMKAVYFVLALLVLAAATSSWAAEPPKAAEPAKTAKTVKGTKAITATAAVITPTTLDWPHYGNQYNNQRFQNVDQINPSNVGSLKVAWVFHTGVVDDNSTLEVTPIVINGVMYATTGHDDVFALNAVNGAQKWAYHPVDQAPPPTFPLCCGRNNRGVAVGNGKVFLGRLDDSVVALNQATGTVAWQVKLADSAQGYSITMAPQFVTTSLHPNGLIIISLSGGEYEARGQVFALNAANGTIVWMFFTTQGPNTWGGNAYLTGGAFQWNTPSIDTTLGLVYLNTGNAAPDVLGQNRPGINLYSCSLVALNLDTGNLIWFFQEVHHDLWDYDAAQTTVLFDLTRNGTTTPAIAHTGKNGELYILDRRNGTPIYPVTEVPVPTTNPPYQNAFPTQPHSAVAHLTPFNCIKPNTSGIPCPPRYTPPSEVVELQQPGAQGGGEWVAAAYSPRTHFLYSPVRYEPTSYVTHPDNNEPTPIPGQIPPEFVGSDFGRSLLTTNPFGIFGATDTTTGQIAWENDTKDLATSDMTVTGDLVWYGQDNGNLNAANAATGQILFTFNANTVPGAGGANAGAIAYVVNGKEYIAYAFGGNVLERANQQVDLPGDAIIAFTLP
jgi:quinohemoprotein ethanol dehydrogenase